MADGELLAKEAQQQASDSQRRIPQSSRRTASMRNDGADKDAEEGTPPSNKTLARRANGHHSQFIPALEWAETHGAPSRLVAPPSRNEARSTSGIHVGAGATTMPKTGAGARDRWARELLALKSVEQFSCNATIPRRQ